MDMSKKLQNGGYSYCAFIQEKNLHCGMQSKAEAIEINS